MKKGNRLYQRWQTMWMRCTNPWATNYSQYGGRGIKVCDRWKVYEKFLEDMGEPPFPGAQLDRINNDGDYEPGNVRWANAAEQAVNRRVRRDNTSGVVGVTGLARGRGWEAYAYKKGVKITLYWGKDFDAAVKARKDWEANNRGY